MCDYSLMEGPSRLAIAGENLVIHRFPTNSLGLVSLEDSLSAGQCSSGCSSSSIWSALQSFFNRSDAPIIAVCVPPGTRLVLHGIQPHIRQHFNVDEVEEVTFTQLTAAAYIHRDAFRFRNGREVLLQAFAVGQCIQVLSLPASAEVSYEDVEQLGAPAS